MTIGKGAIKLALVIAAATVLITIIVVSYLSGSQIDLESVLPVLGGVLVGAFGALGLRKSGGIFILCFALTSASCAAPWSYARATLAGAETALEYTEGALPDGNDDAETAVRMSRSAITLGNHAVDLWEASRQESPPAIWPKAVAMLVCASAFILDLLKELGVVVPPFIINAFDALQMLSAAV